MLSKPVPSKQAAEKQVPPRLLRRTVKVGVACQLASLAAPELDRTCTKLPEKKICLRVIYQNDVLSTRKSGNIDLV